MKKFKIVLSIITLVLLSIHLEAQETNNNTIALGFNINQIQNDYGLGVDLISPYFANQKVAVKIGGSVKWLQHLNDSSEYTWSTYSNAQLGIRGRQFIVEDKIFVYGEGGLLFIFPNSNVSEKSFVLGGYGLFGSEFKLSPKFGFYFEMGGVGSSAKADKVAGKPIYSNGFLTNVGFRLNF